MFNLIVILVLAVLATPVIAVAALISANGLRREVRDLESRVQSLERQPVRAPGNYAAHRASGARARATSAGRTGIAAGTAAFGCRNVGAVFRSSAGGSANAAGDWL